MDTSLYISKIEEHLADLSTYKELNSDPTLASEMMSFPPLIISKTLTK